VLAMATRVERGTCGTPPLSSVDDLPRVRERELRDAVERILSLGVPPGVGPPLAAVPADDLFDRMGERNRGAGMTQARSDPGLCRGPRGWRWA